MRLRPRPRLRTACLRTARRLVPLSLLAIACVATTARAQTPLPPQTPLTQSPTRDTSPSDPAALGFLQGFVDRQVYTLAGAGATQALAQAQLVVQNAGQNPTSTRYEALINFETLEMSVNIIGAADVPLGMRLLVQSLSEHALTGLASHADRQNVVRLERDGAEIRLEMIPRVKGTTLFPTIAWYSKDGLPLRRRVVKIGEKGSIQEETTIELKLARNGQYLVSREITTAPGFPEKVLSLEYQEQGGYNVLRQLRLESGGAVITVAFKMQITPKTAGSPDAGTDEPANPGKKD